MRNLILYGFKSCGKTSFGKSLSRKLGRPFYDTDDLMRKISGLSPRELELKYGPEHFQQIELQAVQELATLKGAIIATGGRTLLSAEARSLLQKQGSFIYLKIPKEILKARIFVAKELPSFLRTPDPHATFDQLYETRTKVFESIADIVLKGPNFSKALRISQFINH